MVTPAAVHSQLLANPLFDDMDPSSSDSLFYDAESSGDNQEAKRVCRRQSHFHSMTPFMEDQKSKNLMAEKKTLACEYLVSQMQIQYEKFVKAFKQADNIEGEKEIVQNTLSVVDRIAEAVFLFDPSAKSQLELCEQGFNEKIKKTAAVLHNNKNLAS